MGLLGIAGSIVGGYQSRKKMRQAKRMIQAEKDKNQAWYERRYNEDSTQRADAQRLLEMTRKGIEERNKQAQGISAVMGGDDAAIAAAQERNNASVADVMSSINAQGEARKANIEQQYQARDAELSGQQIGMKQQEAAATAKAWTEAGNALDKMGEQLVSAMTGGALGGGAGVQKAGSILGNFF